MADPIVSFAEFEGSNATAVRIEPGDDARAQVNFPRHGVKWLALSVAKLTPVN